MNSWRTLKLPECLEKSPRAAKIPRKKFKGSGRFPIVSQEKGLVNGYWDDENDAITVDRPIIIYGDHTQVVKLVDFDFVVGADGVRLLKPKSFLKPEYLYYFLLGNPVKALGYARHFRLLKDIDVTIPSLPEQKRIVAILDEAFAGIVTALANTEKNLANARELFESYLNGVFSEQGKGWIRKKLREVTTKIGSGATPRGGQSAYKDQGTSLIRSLNIYDRRFKGEKLAFIDDAQAARLSNVIVSEGDVLFNITGASIARCCVAPQVHLPARVNQHVAILRPVHSELDSEFLCYLMTSKAYKDRLLGIGDEGGSTRQAITKSQLQNLAIALPVRGEQSRIVEELNALETESQRLEYIFEQKRLALAELKQSLLQRAFSGELTAAPRDEIETALA